MEGIELALEAVWGGAQVCEVICIEQAGHRKASKGRGGVVSSLYEWACAVYVKAEEEGAEGAPLLDSSITREWIGKARGAVNTACDPVIECLEGNKHGTMDASLAEAMSQEVAGDQFKGFS